MRMLYVIFIFILLSSYADAIIYFEGVTTTTLGVSYDITQNESYINETCQNVIDGQPTTTTSSTTTTTLADFILESENRLWDYNKTMSNATYAFKGDYITSAGGNATYQYIGDYLTSARGNATYQYIGDYLLDSEGRLWYYNKTESNLTYAFKGDYLTSARGNATYQYIGDYLLDSEGRLWYYNKTESNLTYAFKGDYLTSARGNATYQYIGNYLLDASLTPLRNNITWLNTNASQQKTVLTWLITNATQQEAKINLKNPLITVDGCDLGKVFNNFNGTDLSCVAVAPATLNGTGLLSTAGIGSTTLSADLNYFNGKYAGKQATINNLSLKCSLTGCTMTGDLKTTGKGNFTGEILATGGIRSHGAVTPVTDAGEALGTSALSWGGLDVQGDIVLSNNLNMTGTTAVWSWNTPASTISYLKFPSGNGAFGLSSDQVGGFILKANNSDANDFVYLVNYKRGIALGMGLALYSPIAKNKQFIPYDTKAYNLGTASYSWDNCYCDDYFTTSTGWIKPASKTALDVINTLETNIKTGEIDHTKTDASLGTVDSTSLNAVIMAQAEAIKELQKRLIALEDKNGIKHYDNIGQTTSAVIREVLE